MNYENSIYEQIIDLVRTCLNKLYKNDRLLFERNDGNGVCERSLVFRFAYYLQNEIDDYYVDCDFNSSFEGFMGPNGIIGRDRHGKPIQNIDGTVTKRFVDIIVHRRSRERDSDFIVFEFKKWTNGHREDYEKDRNNLRVMTTRYGYRFGFHIIFGPTIRETEWTIFENGIPIINHQLVLNHATRD